MHDIDDTLPVFGSKVESVLKLGVSAQNMAGTSSAGFCLSEICNALEPVKHKWFKLGIQFGIAYHKLKEFTEEKDPLTATLDYCLKGNVETASLCWEVIARTLETPQVDEPGVAKDIRLKYCQQQRQKARDPSEVPEEIEGDLTQQLEANLRDISSKYANFVSNATVILREQKDFDIESLRSHIHNYLQFDSHFSSELKGKLTSAETVSKICEFISFNFASFLNCEVFGELLKKFGGDAGMKEWENYQKHLTDYVNKHKIDEFTRIKPGLLVPNIDDRVKVVLKVNINKFSHLMKVHEIQIKFADILKINHSNLLLLDIKDGCVLLTFLIPVSVAKTTFAPDMTFTMEQVKALQKLSIKWFLCGDHYMMIENPNECPMEDVYLWHSLMEACQNGHTELTKLLLENGAHVNLQDNNGWSALMFACENGRTEGAKLLLENGAKVNLQDNDGWSALMLACENGHTELTKLLIENGAHVNLQDNYYGWSALFFANENEHTEVAKLLLEKGAEVNLQDNCGGSALMLACDSGCTEVAKLLIENGAEVNMQDNYSRSALFFAHENEHTEVAKLLLEKGAKVNLQDDYGLICFNAKM